MCILFFIVDDNPAPGHYRLILASNRDEFYARPALPAAPWTENPFLYGGRDMEPGRQGGTWLGLGSRGGLTKVGALLNVTGESKRKSAAGRGQIISNYIGGHAAGDDFAKSLIGGEQEFNAFNLVTIDMEINKPARIVHCSNAPATVTEFPSRQALGFGNTPVGQPLQKVRAGTELFERLLATKQSHKETLVASLMDDLLKCNQKFWPDDELMRRAPNWGEHLSRVCVKMPEAGYGSRTRTVILIDWQNQMDLYEETMITPDPDGEWKRTHIFRQL